MKKYHIDWSSEIRRFIKEHIELLELLEILDGIGEKAGRRRTRIDSTKLIRETRGEH
jgi:hypothetical protein